MEPALKTRLLGAAVLIALAIIFVPMFFSGSGPKTSGDQSVSLDIPAAPDRQLQSRTLTVGPDSASASADADDPNHVATVDVDAGQPRANAPEDVAVAPSQPAPQPVAPPPPSVTPPPAQLPAARQVAKATPPAPAVAAAPGSAAKGAYSLNLGVYATHGNADKLIARVRKLGLPAFGESADYNGKPATRVRVGPFADRAAAEAARLKLKTSDPHVPIALTAGAADQTKDAPPSAVAANRAGGWAVQLAAFGNEADAIKMRDRLRQLGFDGYVDDISSGSGKLWRVRAGPVNERAAAEQLRTQIAARMKISGIIVTQS